MRRQRVLIVEDDPMVALDLEAIVLGAADAEVAVANSVKEASRVLDEAAFDAALLDIDVLDGKTFAVAHRLAERGTPFAFVSGARREDVPTAAAPGALPAQALRSPGYRANIPGQAGA